MYTERAIPLVPAGTGVLGAETLTAATAVHGEMLVVVPCRVKRIMFYVTTAIAANLTVPVVTFRKRPTYNSSGSQSTIGTLTIPDLTAIGKVLYKDVTPVDLQPGDTICYDHTTQATDSGSAAGAGFYMVDLELDPEYKANITDFVASA